MTGSRRFFGGTLGQSVPDRAFMFEFLPPRVRLQGEPHAGEREARQIAEDFERFRDGLPRPLEAYVHSAYGLDLASTYGGWSVKNLSERAPVSFRLPSTKFRKTPRRGSVSPSSKRSSPRTRQARRRCTNGPFPKLECRWSESEGKVARKVGRSPGRGAGGLIPSRPIATSSLAPSRRPGPPGCWWRLR